MKKNTLLLFSLLFNSLLYGQFHYEVKLLDSALLHPSSVEVKDPMFGKAWLSVDGERYEFNRIIHYQNQDGFFRVVTTQGKVFPQIFKLEKPGNRIGLYSQENWANTAPRYSPGFGGMPGTWTGGSGPYKVKSWYYAKGEGRIWSLNLDNISGAVGDNPEAMEAVKKAKQARSTSRWMVVGGIGLTVVGFVATANRLKEEGNKPPSEQTNNPLKLASPIMLVGLVTLPFTGIPRKAKERRLQEAIDIYNR